MSLTLIFKCTIKDALKRAGLDPKEHWEHQPKDKLARIYWVVSSCHQLWYTYCAELIWKVKEHQPYLVHFAHNWPIEEYIKCHHKSVHAYLKKLDDGTNATLPDINSEEFSDVQHQETLTLLWLSLAVFGSLWLSLLMIGCTLESKIL